MGRSLKYSNISVINVDNGEQNIFYNLSDAANFVGISKQTVYSDIKKYGSSTRKNFTIRCNIKHNNEAIWYDFRHLNDLYDVI